MQGEGFQKQPLAHIINLRGEFVQFGQRGWLLIGAATLPFLVPEQTPLPRRRNAQGLDQRGQIISLGMDTVGIKAFQTVSTRQALDLELAAQLHHAVGGQVEKHHRRGGIAHQP